MGGSCWGTRPFSESPALRASHPPRFGHTPDPEAYLAAQDLVLVLVQEGRILVGAMIVEVAVVPEPSLALLVAPVAAVAVLRRVNALRA